MTHVYKMFLDEDKPLTLLATFQSEFQAKQWAESMTSGFGPKAALVVTEGEVHAVFRGTHGLAAKQDVA
jgi:hypothetical protein